MLYLDRRVGEKVVIHAPEGAVTVQVTKLKGDKVSLGIDAPPEVVVLREEVKFRPQKAEESPDGSHLPGPEGQRPA